MCAVVPRGASQLVLCPSCGGAHVPFIPPILARHVPTPFLLPVHVVLRFTFRVSRCVCLLDAALLGDWGWALGFGLSLALGFGGWVGVRPTLWNSCRAGCSQVRKDICHRSCEIELDEKRRNNIMLCRNGVSRKCETICQPFHAKLPRPLMYNICEEACETTAKEGCEAGHGAMAHIRDLQDATAFLADGK